MNLPLRVVEVQTLAAAAASVTFSGIGAKVPSGSRHLVVLINAASADAVNDRNIALRFNGDTGGNYQEQFLQAEDATVTAERNNGQDKAGVGTIPGATITPASGGMQVLIPHAFNTTGHKMVLACGGAAERKVGLYANRWANTVTIDSITILPNSGNFVANSRFVLCVVDERFRLAESRLAAPATFSFTGLPAGSGDLVVIGYLRSERVGDAFDNVLISENGDTTAANYRRDSGQGENLIASGLGGASRIVGKVTGSVAVAGSYGVLLLEQPQHGRAYNFRAWNAQSGMHDVGQGNAMYGVHRHDSEAPVTSLAFTSEAGANFAIDSLMSVYFAPRESRCRARTILDSTASFSFGSLPTLFDDQTIMGWIIRGFWRLSDADTLAAVRLHFNGDEPSAANYDDQELFANGSAGTIGAVRNNALARIFRVYSNLATAGRFSPASVLMLNPTSTAFHKHRIGQGGGLDRASLISGRWKNTAALSSILLYSDNALGFLSGSVAELEAIVAGKPAVDLIFGTDVLIQTTSITYTGTWLTYPIITIRGPLKKAKIENLATGEIIEFDYSIPLGRTVTIDLTPGQKTVKDDLGTNLIGTLTPESDLGTFHIAPAPEAAGGVNQIKVTGFWADKNTAITIVYNTRYFGI